MALRTASDRRLLLAHLAGCRSDKLRTSRQTFPEKFRADVTMRYLRCHLERKANLGYRLWGLLILFLWMQRWKIEASTPTTIESGASDPSRHAYLIVLVFAAAVYLACIVSPPSLMDDVDAVHAQIARNMLTSGDWVTARLDGVAYMEKAPLLYWMIAGFFRVSGSLRLGGAAAGCALGHRAVPW